MKVSNYDEARKAAEAHKSERYKQLETLERFVETTQYDHISENFFDSDAPLWERRPVLVFPIVEQAIASNIDLILGEGRFPQIQTNLADASDAGEPNELDELLEDVSFDALCREALEMAQGSRSAAVLFSVDEDGEIQGSTVKAKWCTPEFDGKRVKRIEIQYPFIETVGTGSKAKAVAKLYRRVIDEKSDTVYIPVEIDAQEHELQWSVQESVEHGFGFCPVIWYPHLKPCTVHNVFDGVAIHERLTEEIRQHDLARSQWHRMGLYSEPQVVERGVPHGYNPTSAGDTTVRDVIPATVSGGAVGPDNPATSSYQVPLRASARKKGPGQVWQYTNPETEVDYLIVPSDALEAMSDNVADIRVKLQEGLAVVFLDPENLKFASQTSGKTLERLLQRQINRCGKIRTDFKRRFVVPALKMLAQIATIKGIRKIGEITKVTLKWGPWFPPEFADVAQYVTALVAAFKGGITTQEQATRLLAAQLGTTDIDALVEAVKAEAEEREKKAMENARVSAERGQGPGIPGRRGGPERRADERGGSGRGNQGGRARE